MAMWEPLMSIEMSSLEGGPSDLAERFIASTPEMRQRIFRQFTESLRAAIVRGGLDTASAAIRGALSPSFDYTSAQTVARIHKQLISARGTRPGTTRVAVLASFTSKQLVSLFEVFLYAAGVDAKVYDRAHGHRNPAAYAPLEYVPARWRWLALHQDFVRGHQRWLFVDRKARK